MAVAVAKALEARRRRGHLRLDRQHGLLGGGLRGPRRPDAPSFSARPGRSRRRSSRSRAPSARGVLEVRGSFDEALRSCLEIAERGSFVARQLAQPGPDRGPEDRRVRDRRAARTAHPTCSRCPTAAAATRSPTRRASPRTACAPRIVSAHAAERATTIASAIRIAEPAHLAEVDGARRRRPRRARPRLRRRHHANVARARTATRASSASRPRPPASPRSRRSSSSRASTVVCVLTGHGLKDTAAVDLITSVRDPRRADRRGDPRRGGPMSATRFVVTAPATTANLGPGFDCAGGGARPLERAARRCPAGSGEPLVTLEGEGRDELPRDETHLALRAFALAAPLEGHRFHFVNRIPLERGLGSSRGDGRRRARRRAAPSPGASTSPERAARARAAARGPRRQPRRGARAAASA